MNSVLTRRPRAPASAEHGRAGTRTELDRFLGALHAGEMGPRLQKSLGGGPATCHVLDAKYEPGVRAIVLYEHGGALVRGDLVSPSDDSEPAELVGPGVRLSRFPHDPEMPALTSVLDPARLGPALTAALGCRSYGGSDYAARCRLRLLRYRPGKRATVLVALPGDRTRYVAKVYHDPGKAATVAGESPALAAIVSSGRLQLPATVAHVPALGVVVQHEVAGTALDMLLTSPRSAAARGGIDSAARALAELHRAGVVTERQRSVAQELHRFRGRAARIASVDPRTGTVLGHVADRLIDLHDHLPAARTGPVHGDCKPSQFLCAGGRVHLLDLDHVGVSDQAADIGTFVASLRQRALRDAAGRSPRSRLDDLLALADAFVDSYLSVSGAGQDHTRIRWQEAVALQRKALRAFARAPRSPLVVALAEEAGRCLDRLDGP